MSVYNNCCCDFDIFIENIILLLHFLCNNNNFISEVLFLRIFVYDIMKFPFLFYQIFPVSGRNNNDNKELTEQKFLVKIHKEFFFLRLVFFSVKSL